MEWPDERWPHWHRYEGKEGRKYASKDASRLPPACSEIVRHMLNVSVEKHLGIAGTFPDVTLHGAGMHMIPPGGSLPLHLDGDHHPVTGWGRAVSLVLWLDDWPSENGGQLRLWDENKTAPIVSVTPQPGRLAMFECGPKSWHDVSTVSEASPMPRRSLAVFFWTPTTAHHERSRAEFVR
jgi:Rps23 Pro-64 3,4-dihydroxylase Tpa1-like proline 4-hydroxylase